METGAEKGEVDLGKIVAVFNAWQRTTLDLQQENRSQSLNVKKLQKQLLLLEESRSSFSEENSQLRSTIDRLQGIISRRCDLEEENVQLKEQLQLVHKEAAQLELQHSQQMAESLENLRAVQQAHSVEITRLQNHAHSQMKKEVEAMQKTIAEKTSVIQQLQKQLADAERDKHTEIVKLRLECDARLLKLQKQTSKAPTQPNSVNSDIFRRKLQHAKAESEREMSTLRKRVADLEKQLTLANKRRKF